MCGIQCEADFLYGHMIMYIIFLKYIDILSFMLSIGLNLAHCSIPSRNLSVKRSFGGTTILWRHRSGLMMEPEPEMELLGFRNIFYGR